MTTDHAAAAVPFPRLVEVADRTLVRLLDDLRVAEVQMDDDQIGKVRAQMDTALDMRSRGTGTSSA